MEHDNFDLELAALLRRRGLGATAVERLIHTVSNSSPDAHAEEPSADEVHEEALSPYFTNEDLVEMGAYERECRHKQLENYQAAVNDGVSFADALKPLFVKAAEIKAKRKKDKETTSDSSENSKKCSKGRGTVSASSNSAAGQLGDHQKGSPFAEPSRSPTVSGSFRPLRSATRTTRSATQLNNNQRETGNTSYTEIPVCEFRSCPDAIPSTSAPARQARISSLSTDQTDYSQRDIGNPSYTGRPHRSSLDSSPSISAPARQPMVSSVSAELPNDQRELLALPSSSHSRLSASSCRSEHHQRGKPHYSSEPGNSSVLHSRSDNNQSAATSSASQRSSSDMTNQLLIQKAELPQFDCLEILENHFKNTNENKRKILNRLKDGEVITSGDRKLVVRTLTRWLFFNHVSDPSKVTTTMKEGMAKSFVCQFNQFAAMNDSSDVPWAHIYSTDSNTGWIANSSRSVQNKHRRRKTSKSKDNDSDGPVSDLDSDGIQRLALTMPGRQERSEILQGMELSFASRVKERSQSKTIAFFMEKYPHFKSYGGEVVKEEFQRLYRDAQDMCSLFKKLQVNILALPSKRNVVPNLNDPIVMGLLLLSQHLPHDIPRKGDDVSHTWAEEKDIVVILQASDDVEESILARRADGTGQVQPYLIAVQSQITKAIVRTFLVLDNSAVQLCVGGFLKAFDLLMQSYYVFNVHFPFGRVRRDKATPTEFELWMKIK